MCDCQFVKDQSEYERVDLSGVLRLAQVKLSVGVYLHVTAGGGRTPLVMSLLLHHDRDIFLSQLK